MKFGELQKLLASTPEAQLSIVLPDGASILPSFHVTEVGRIDKTFIDCGGRTHTQRSCQLQVWLGDDVDHRLGAGKLAAILDMARVLIIDDFLDVEIEYESTVISQYRVARAFCDADTITLMLEAKHTDCLAKELCLTPACCDSSSGCCETGA